MDTGRTTSNSDCYRGHIKEPVYLVQLLSMVFFRQFDVFNQYTFLKYLKELQSKFRKLPLFIDRAVQHHTSIVIRKHLEENKDVIRVEYLPTGSSDYNAVEECWRQGKEDLLVKYYPRFSNLKSAITNYYRTKRFKLDITPMRNPLLTASL